MDPDQFWSRPFAQPRICAVKAWSPSCASEIRGPTGQGDEEGAPGGDVAFQSGGT